MTKHVTTTLPPPDISTRYEVKSPQGTYYGENEAQSLRVAKQLIQTNGYGPSTVKVWKIVETRTLLLVPRKSAKADLEKSTKSSADKASRLGRVTRKQTAKRT